MIAASRKHLDEAGKSYWPHCMFAVKNGFFLVWIGIISVLHGFCPAFRPFYTRHTVLRMSEEAQKREAGIGRV